MRERGVHGAPEVPTGQYSGRHPNVLPGLTAWVMARRKDAIGIFDWCAFLIVLAVGAFNMTHGREAAMSQTGLKYGYPPGPYLILGSAVLPAAAGDVRMVVRPGIVGTTYRAASLAHVLREQRQASAAPPLRT